MADIKQIGRYQIVELLGQGGMARVYCAYDPNFRRDVALKIMSDRLAHDDAFRQRFYREAQTIARLEHRAIVPVYDFGEEDGRPYLVMRLMTGGSLADRLKHGPLPIPTIQRVLERIGDALDKAHAADIVHRDLKPGNILFDDDAQPYLSDFGIVKSSSSTKLTATGGLVGTPAYMSPEQVLGKETVDGRSDIYALGAVLYEMLSGRQPYDSETGMGAAMAQLTQPVPRLSDTAPQLGSRYQGVIDRAMAKEAGDRFQHGIDLANAFRNPASVSTAEQTVIETWADETVIEPVPGEAATMPVTVAPVAAVRQPITESGGSPWKVFASALGVLLLLAIVGGYLVVNYVLPGAESAEPAVDPTLVALAATSTTQAQQMATTRIAQTAAAEARETMAAEAKESATSPPSQTAAFPIHVVGEGENLALIAQQYGTAGEAILLANNLSGANTIVPGMKLLIPPGPIEEQPAGATGTATPEPTLTPTASATPTNTPQPDLGPEWIKIGSTVSGEPIDVVRFGAGPNKIVLVGGLHAGFAPASVVIAENLVRHFEQNPHEVPAGVTVYVIPSVNKDSANEPGEWAGRANANKVDLNRNWDCNWIRDATWRGTAVKDSGGTAPFSEPETRALRDFFLEIDPVVVIIWEARFKNGLISPGQCKSATSTTRASYAVAGVYGSASGYPVDNYEAEANQVINGDVNNWLDSVGIPSLAVLLDQYEEPDWTNNLEGVRAVIAHHAG